MEVDTISTCSSEREILKCISYIRKCNSKYLKSKVETPAYFNSSDFLRIQ